METTKLLTISGIHKIKGLEYYGKKFICTNVVDTPTAYRFQFEDVKSPAVRYVWVEILRNGQYNYGESKWEWRMNYPHCPTHIVTADYIRKWDNVIKLFEVCLEPASKTV
jgi:hypothetical protein